MRRRKRLNLIVLALVLILFSGTAFAYNIGDLLDSGQVPMGADTVLMVGDRWVTANPPTLAHNIAVLESGMNLNLTDFSIQFTAPGQSVAYHFTIHNVWDNPVTINANNLRLGNTAIANSVVWEYEWLMVEFLPSSDVIIPAGGHADWGFMLTFNPDFATDRNYFSDEMDLNIGILQPELPEEPPTEEPPTGEPPAEELSPVPPILPGTGDDTSSDDTSVAVPPVTQASSDIAEIIEAETIEIEALDVPLAAFDGDTFVTIDDLDTPLAAFDGAEPENTNNHDTIVASEVGYIHIEDLDVPLGFMPQTGLESRIPLLISGLALAAGIALLLIILIRKSKRTS